MTQRVGAVRLVPLAVLLLLVPLAAADSETGRTVGLDLGNSSVGSWDVYQFGISGGTTVLSLTWAGSQFPIPFADYNLFLYPPGSFDDNSLANNERLAESWHGGGFQPESINRVLPAGTYWVAVAPWQTQGETYTLWSNTGSLTLAARAQGVQSCSPCP